MAECKMMVLAEREAAKFQGLRVPIPVLDNGFITHYVAWSATPKGGMFIPMNVEEISRKKVTEPLIDKDCPVRLGREYFKKKGYSDEQISTMLKQRFFFTYQTGDTGEDITVFIAPEAWSRYGKHLGYGTMPETVSPFQGLAMTESLFRSYNQLRIEALQVGRDAYIAVGFFTYRKDIEERQMKEQKTEEILKSFALLGEKDAFTLVDYRFEPNLSYVTAINNESERIGSLRPAVRCMTSDTGMFADRMEDGFVYGDSPLFFPVRAYSVRGMKTKNFDRKKDLIDPFLDVHRQFCLDLEPVSKGLERWLDFPTEHAGQDADRLLEAAHLWEPKCAGRKRRSRYMEEGMFNIQNGTGRDTLRIMMRICEELDTENRDWLSVRKVCPEVGGLLWCLGKWRDF